MKVKEYFEECMRFDWYYNFSDDGGVWRAGTEAKEKLIAEAETDPVKMKIFGDWNKHMFSGNGWSTPQAPKPELENYDVKD